MNALNRNKTIISLVLMILVSVSNLALHSDIEFSVKGILVAAISPFQKLFHTTYSTFGKLWAGITEINFLKVELQLTRKKLEKYEEVAQNLSEIKKENARLRKLLGFKQRSPFEVIPAQVIAKSPENFFRIIIINKGSAHGVKKYMPVVAYFNGEKAIVGKIIEVSWYVSKVLPIIDSMSNIGGILQNSRYAGLISGNAPLKDTLTMKYIVSRAALKKNEQVVSSGEGGIFPKGLLIGKVKSFENYISGGYKNCIVIPHIEFGSLDQVLIIKKEINKEIQSLLKNQK